MAINTNPSSRRALLAAAAGGTVALVAESLARPLPPGFRSYSAREALGSPRVSTNEAPKWVNWTDCHRYHGDAHSVLT
jgi:hypothetical protein